MSDDRELWVEPGGGGWRLAGPAAGGFVLVNDYLGYLADRRYSPATVRSYAYDLLALCRWLLGEGLVLESVTTDVLLRFLTACRTAVLPGQAANVFSIRDGRNVGYAPATTNRRLAAISGLFGFWQMRDPSAANPVPRGKPARSTASGERQGLLGHLATPAPRSRLRVRQPRRLPRGLDREEVTCVAGQLQHLAGPRDRRTDGAVGSAVL